MELTAKSSGVYLNEAECDCSDVQTKMEKMIELKKHLFSKAEQSINSAQERYKKDHDRKRAQSKV